jgi:transitional endoplasmic reticulum ATPase
VQKVIESPEQARRLGVEPPSGLLLYGPPGTGKTTIAKILASQASCSFFAASPADVFSKWIGEGEKAVSNLFAQARAAAPSIVFLDEIDALVPNRSGGVSQPSDKIVNQFLHEIDGLSGNQGVFVVGATNRPELLDDAVIRGGRLSLKIEIPAPDKDSRLSILALHTRGVVLSPDVDIEQLATETEGYSGADLRALVNDAGLEALVRITDEGGAECLTTEDFEHAKRAIQPDVAPGN